MNLKIDAQRIKAERQARGWSQEQLAAAAGLGVRTIQRIESGSAASAESAKCLAAVFERPLSQLLAGEPVARRPRRRLWAAAVLACTALGSSLFLMSRANATDVGMAVKLGTGAARESRMNLVVSSGGQTEIKLEKDIRLVLRPTIQEDGTIFLATEVYGWDGSGFTLAGKPALLMRQGEETRLKLGLPDGRSAQVGITPRATEAASPRGWPAAFERAARHAQSALPYALARSSFAMMTLR